MLKVEESPVVKFHVAVTESCVETKRRSEIGPGAMKESD